MIPGLSGFVNSSSYLIEIAANVVDFDAFAYLGSPAGVLAVSIVVKSGITVSASDATVPAMDLTGFETGTEFDLVNLGYIHAAGGEGQHGYDGDFGIPDEYKGGGGGGGAGNAVGPGGGHTGSSATDGADGTLTTGGAGGMGAYEAPSVEYTPGDETPGQDGGDAINAGDFALQITNASGQIWGGGGGGSGGYLLGGLETVATAGGATATAGLGDEPGDAGYAVRGTAVTFVSGGSSPNVKGAVG